MNQTQSIIVYRNPLEAAIWEGTMSGGFPLLVGILAGILVTAFVCSMWDRVWRKVRMTSPSVKLRRVAYRAERITGVIAMVTAVATLFGVMWAML